MDNLKMGELIRESYMWYDYGTGKSSGHMEIEQGEKAPDAFYGLIGDLMS